MVISGPVLGAFDAIDGAVTAILRGDFDLNFDFEFDVDGADFLLWQRGGSPNPLSASDRAAWESNFGATSAAAAAAAVPEPSSLALLAIGLLSLGRTRKRR